MSETHRSAPAPHETAGTPQAPDVPQVRFRLRVTVGELNAIGPGKIALLEAIETTGSITAAAKQLNMSYRRAWDLLDELNTALRQPVVLTAKGGTLGGGTTITPQGKQLMLLYRRIEHTAQEACKQDLHRLVGMLNG